MHATSKVFFLIILLNFNYWIPRVWYDFLLKTNDPTWSVGFGVCWNKLLMKHRLTRININLFFCFFKTYACNFTRKLSLYKLVWRRIPIGDCEIWATKIIQNMGHVHYLQWAMILGWASWTRLSECCNLTSCLEGWGSTHLFFVWNL